MSPDEFIRRLSKSGIEVPDNLEIVEITPPDPEEQEWLDSFKNVGRPIKHIGEGKFVYTDEVPSQETLDELEKMGSLVKWDPDQGCFVEVKDET